MTAQTSSNIFPSKTMVIVVPIYWFWIRYAHCNVYNKSMHATIAANEFLMIAKKD